MNKRVLFSNNGTIEDFSTAMDEYRSPSKVINFKSATDALYIGSRLPFNHTFFKLETPNTADCKLTAQYWTGTGWTTFVETIDETNGFKNSGYLTFVPDRNQPWMMSSTNYGGQKVQGLETQNIYDLYWIKITFNADFVGPQVPESDPATYQDVKLQWLGYMFSNDYDIAGESPDFVRPNVMKAFESGKTSWEEQHSIAAKLLVADMVSKNIVDDGAQILNRGDYTLAATSKVCELICAGLGDDYVDDKKAYRDEYKTRLSLRIHKVDKNKNGSEEVVERYNTTGWFSR